MHLEQKNNDESSWMHKQSIYPSTEPGLCWKYEERACPYPVMYRWCDIWYDLFISIIYSFQNLQNEFDNESDIFSESAIELFMTVEKKPLLAFIFNKAYKIGQRSNWIIKLGIL